PSEIEEYQHKYYANKFRSDARVEQTIRESINSYVELVKSQELMDLSQVNIDLHKDYLVTAQEKEQISGEILESYQVNSKKHAIIDQYLEQEDQKIEANTRFERYTQSELEGDICRPVIDEKFIPESLEKALEISVSKNYKILEQVAKIKEQRENIIQANAANLPTLKFQWQGSWDNDLINAENGREDAQRMRLILNWNLFEGFKTQDSKDRENLFLQEQQKLLDAVTQEVIEEVTTSYNAYYKAKQRIENMVKFVDDNRNIKNVYAKQLADGTRTFIDILNAESELYRSQIDHLDQEFGLYTHYYDLLGHMGILSDSILMAKNQICDAFTATEYKSSIKKTPQDDGVNELNDEDLLQEIGDPTSNMDDEIDNLINGTGKASNNTVETQMKKSLPQGKYTINVTTLSKNEDVATFTNKMDLTDENVHAYNMSLGTKILYGNYNTLKDATVAMNGLSKQVLNIKVYVDNLEKHRKLLEKYSSIN
ncbi:MAG: TolC family protein, partial [Campylobacterota bacterium]|nr:TolC family protein [Campylobacterota bacterium]